MLMHRTHLQLYAQQSIFILIMIFNSEYKEDFLESLTHMPLSELLQD